MRARARHFNPRDAGAAFCIDARFISGLSDGNSVSTWNDRTRNAANATQANTALQPQYKTSTQGGQPVVRFDGSNDWMEMAVANSNAEASIVIVGIAIGGTNFDGRISFHGSSGSDFDSTQYLAISQGDSGPLKYRVDRTNANLLTPTDTSPIASIVFDGSTCNLYQASASSASASSAGSFAWTQATLSARFVSSVRSNIGQNDIMNVSVFNLNVSDSVRRRLEHAAAYSFKIPCN